jgi:hypothetical protein
VKSTRSVVWLSGRAQRAANLVCYFAHHCTGWKPVDRKSVDAVDSRVVLADPQGLRLKMTGSQIQRVAVVSGKNLASRNVVHHDAVVSEPVTCEYGDDVSVDPHRLHAPK